MVFSLPIIDTNQTDIRKLGTIIQELNTLTINSSSISIEPSVVIDTDCFEDYRKSRILSDRVVLSCIEHLKRMCLSRVDMYLSFYRDCLVDDTPVTIPVSFSALYNAIVALYERWFDGKPFARRSVLHIQPIDTFPAILFQPHREEELTTITRHPSTGKLMQSGDGISIVHCSNSVLTEAEETMIRTIDNAIDLPRKIVYVNSTNQSCVIRRCVAYPMTADARVAGILSKYEKGSFSRLKAISLLMPENIASIIGQRYTLTAKIQHSGIAVFPGRSAAGYAVFQWSDASLFTDKSIFLSTEAEPEIIPIMATCMASIFSRGGLTSHGAVASRIMEKTCIVCASDLRFDWDNKRVFTCQGEIIHEGDKICIVNNQWSVGGDIVPNDNYKASCSENTMEKLRDLLLPYSDPKVLKTLCLDIQLHIASLIHVMVKSGWFR